MDSMEISEMRFIPANSAEAYLLTDFAQCFGEAWREEHGTDPDPDWMSGYRDGLAHALVVLLSENHEIVGDFVPEWDLEPSLKAWGASHAGECVTRESSITLEF